jgi:prephenate dehydratase
MGAAKYTLFLAGIEMKVAYQGEPGAFSEIAVLELFPNAQAVSCGTFDQAFDAVKTGEVDVAVIPTDNTLAGRVADVHRLLPEAGLFIIAEHCLEINHYLMAIKGAKLSELTHVHSHVHALPQCSHFIKEHSLMPVVHADTAGSAYAISLRKDPTQAAIASHRAAAMYGLSILAERVQNTDGNKTRFVVLSRQKQTPDLATPSITSLLFEVGNEAAALHKVLSVFAGEGLNLIKLESYMGAEFKTTQFYCEVVAHEEGAAFQRAYALLQKTVRNVRNLGCFPESPKK